MTERRTQRPGSRQSGIDLLKAVLVLAVLLAVFTGTAVIARQEAVLPVAAPTVATQLIIPGSSGSEERLLLAPVPTAVRSDQLRPVARSRSSR